MDAHPSSRQQWIDEVQAEISMCLGMLYPIIEVFRNDDEFAEELSACAVYCRGEWHRRVCVRSEHGAALAHLFLPDAGEPEGSEREELSGEEGAPWVVRARRARSLICLQLLLVTWKSVLACLGGQTELTRVKTVARELAGLSPLKQEGNNASRSLAFA